MTTVQQLRGGGDISSRQQIQRVIKNIRVEQPQVSQVSQIQSEQETIKVETSIGTKNLTIEQENQAREVANSKLSKNAVLDYYDEKDLSPEVYARAALLMNEAYRSSEINYQRNLSLAIKSQGLEPVYRGEVISAVKTPISTTSAKDNLLNILTGKYQPTQFEKMAIERQQQYGMSILPTKLTGVQKVGIVLEKIKGGIEKGVEVGGKGILTGVKEVTELGRVRVTSKGYEKVSTPVEQIKQAGTAIRATTDYTSKQIEEKLPKAIKGGFEFLALPIETKATIEEKRIPIYSKSTLIDKEKTTTEIVIPKGFKTTTIFGDIASQSKQLKVAPSLLSYINPVTSSILLGEQFIKGSEQYVSQEQTFKKQQEQIVQQTFAEQKSLTEEEIEQGYRLLTIEEVRAQVKEDTELNKELKKQIKTQALVNVAVPLAFFGGAAALGGGKYLFGSIVKETEGGVLVTSRARNWLFGEGGYKYKIGLESQPISAGSLSELKQPFTLTYIEKAPTSVIQTGKGTITTIEDISGFGREVVAGEKKIVTISKPDTLLNKIVKIDLTGIKVVSPKEEVVFQGLSPFTKAGKLERVKTIKILEKAGLDKSILRLKQPKIIETKFKGAGEVIESEKGIQFILKGKEKEELVSGEFIDIFGKTTARLGEGKVRYVSIKAIPSGTKGEIEILKGVEESKQAYLTRKGIEFSKLRQAGKTTEISQFLTGSKKVREGEVPIRTIELPNIKVSNLKEFETYQKVDITQKVIPKEIKLDISKARVLVEKGQPKFIISVEGTTDVGLMKGGGKKSSQEYIQTLYQEKKLAPLILEVEKPKIIKSIPTIEQPISFPRMVGGQGLEEIPYLGVGKYERTTGGILGTREVTITDLKPVTTTIDLQAVKTEQKTRVEELPRIDTKFKLDLGIKSQVKIEQAQRIEQKVEQKISQKIEQAQRIELKMIPRLAIKLKTPPPKPPKIKTKITPIPTPTSQIKSIVREITKQGKEEFEVFTRKKGQDISIGKFGTIGEAKVKLKGELIGTLRASGYIEKEGKKIKIEDLGISGGEFARSKIDPFRIIQRKERRIKTGGEIFEITKSRKKERKQSRSWL